MNEQTYLDSPLPATGPWTSLVSDVEDGTYLVIRSDNNEPDVFICDGDNVWADYRGFGPQPAPKLCARVYLEVLGL